MDELIKNLTPLFVAGLAVQQLVELPDAILSLWAPYEKYKKLIIRIIAIACGIMFAIYGNFSVLKTVSATIPKGCPTVPNWLDLLVSGLIVSGGTESFNSIVKFMGYAKEDKKNAAATSTNQAPAANVQQMKWK